MNGYEKISDELKRQEKVNRLKSKILSDINKRQMYVNGSYIQILLQMKTILFGYTDIFICWS